jgi:uncharacterized protein YjiS (DUF1127 family)
VIHGTEPQASFSYDIGTPVILEGRSMSSFDHVVLATRRTGNSPAAVSASSAQLQNNPVTVRRLLLQVRARVEGVWRVLCMWRRRQRDRAELRSLSPRQIRDFCPRQAEAEQEMNKPFWRA